MSIQRPGAAAATLGGMALGALFYLVATARGGRRKALHPTGMVEEAVLERRGCASGTGVPWLDHPGTDQVTVRLSRAVGLPEALPDIHGLAMRIPLPDGDHADLLLATTGTGRLTRFVLRPTRRVRSAYTCLLPYCAPSGPLLLGAWPVAAEEARWTLACAPLTGTWSPFADLVVTDTPRRDAAVSFDPVLHPLPGLVNYEWVAQLRRLAYAGSRRARRAADDGRGRHPVPRTVRADDEVGETSR